MRCVSDHARPQLTAYLWAWAFVSVAAAAQPEPDPAAVLLDRYAAFYERIAHSPFLDALEVESFEGTYVSGGDVHAAVEHPLATVRAAFSSPTAWCDALILHLNVKYCHPVAYEDRVVLSVALGRKSDQPLEKAHRVEFAFRVPASRPDYVAVELEAERGPYGTGHYRIAFEAVGIGEGWSFMRVRYSYEYGVIGRLATRIYLATGGSGKVGFTIISALNDRERTYIGGVRGAIERNTMRYYLALKAYLDTLAVPADERFERSAEHWFDATERYAYQLHELERGDYLAMKRREYARQQTVQ